MNKTIKIEPMKCPECGQTDHYFYVEKEKEFLEFPKENYGNLKDFILSREDDILKDMENFGMLFSTLQWINRVENQSCTEKVKKDD